MSTAGDSLFTNYRYSIMIVEDEALVGLDIQHRLQDMGYFAPFVFAEAREALDSLEQQVPDLVLMDIQLRGEMDGIDAAKEINDRFGIPVLFLTAFASIEVIKRAREAGAYGYLLKPFDSRELQAMVEVALSKHRADGEKKHLDERLQRARKYESLRLMAGGIAHKFNNALHAVLGNLSLAFEDLPPESPVRFDLLEAEKAARLAAGLSRQMLAFSGNEFIRPTELDLNQFMDQSKHIAQELLPTSVLLEFDLADELPLITADPLQLKHILLALLLNSIEALEGGSGTITIRTMVIECDKEYLIPLRRGDFLEEGLYVALEIIDDGCGMDSETVSNVFDPFFSTKFVGRGLGLPATLGIVQAHRGTISITSEPGSGTTARILFPVIKENHLEQSLDASGGSDWHGSGTILLVDHEESVLVLGRKMLERAGFEVLTAADGLEAIEMFKEHSDKVLCIILDLVMPRIGGKEAFRALRRIRPDIRIILSSGYGEQEALHRFSEQGLAGFIRKPYSESSIVKKLRLVLDI